MFLYKLGIIFHGILESTARNDTLNCNCATEIYKSDARRNFSDLTEILKPWM